MYSSLSRRDQMAVRSTLTVAWLLAAGGGMSAIAFSPNTIVSELGTIITTIWAVTVTVASVVALLGVVFDRYRLEWVSSWFAFMGLMPYVATIWWIVTTGELTRLTQAFMMTSLLVFMILRAEFCAAHAAKLRTMHTTETGGIRVPPPG